MGFFSKLFSFTQELAIDLGTANTIIIADGEIAECGTHEELLQTDGIYAQLYKTQNALALEALK